jgi:hypothetical protein
MIPGWHHGRCIFVWSDRSTEKYACRSHQHLIGKGLPVILNRLVRRRRSWGISYRQTRPSVVASRNATIDQRQSLNCGKLPVAHTMTEELNSHAHASARAILYAFVANLTIAVTKTFAAVYTGSGSMLAEAIHSYADSGNQVMLFLG